MKEQLYTIQEVASFLKISSKTLRRWEKAGIIKPIRTVGNQRRYSLEDIKKLERRRKIQQVKKAEIEKIDESFSSPTPIPMQTPVTLPQVREQLSIPQEIQTHVSPQNDPIINSPKEDSFRMKDLSLWLVSSVSALVLLFGGLLFWQHMEGLGSNRDLQAGQKSVLAATTSQPAYQLSINVPGIFGKQTIFLDSVIIKKGLTVDKVATLSGGIITNNANINAGTGTLTASNVIYSIQAGANISISGNKQTPIISANIPGGVTSLQGVSGSVSLTQGSGISLNGLQIGNSGVLSIGGQTGDVTLSAGSGISISGTTITNNDTGSAQNIFKTFSISGTDITASNNNDTINFAAGSGISLAGDAGSKTITITSNASGTISGLTPNGSVYALSSNSLASTVVGPAGTVLHGTGGAPSFSAVSLTADVTGILPTGNGGTGISTTPTNGQVLIGNGSGYQLGTLTAGSGIGVGNGSGTITLSNNGVLSLTGTANQILVGGTTGTPQTGGLKVTLPQDIATTSTPSFAALTLSNTTNQLILGTGANHATITTATLTGGKTYTFPDQSGTVCLDTTGCGGGGGGVGGSGTSGQIAFFNGATSITSESTGFSWDATNKKLGIGTDTPTGKLTVFGAAVGEALGIFNETGDQNIISASASGTTEFNINHNGDLQFTGGSGFLQTLTSTAANGKTYNFPTFTGASADICLDTGNCSGLGGIIGGSGTLDYVPKFTPDGSHIGNSLLYDTGTQVGVNTTSPVGLFDVNGAVSGQALTVLNYTGSDQNILVGSASGVMKFAFDNAGNLNLATGASYEIGGTSVLNSTTLGANVLNSSLTTLGTITTGTWHAGVIATQYGGTGNDWSLVAQGSMPYFSGVGAMSTFGPGSAGQVLQSNGASSAPSWISTSSLNYWQLNLGALSPLNITNDLLLGGTATSSAKFAFENVAGGTPTASISANTANNYLYITGDGSLATTDKQTLTLGSPSTGNIVLSGFSTGVIHSTGGVLSSSTIVNGDLSAGSFTNIQGVGTLTAGTWNAGVIGTQYGGTGQNFSAVAQGAIPYFSNTGVMGTIGAGLSSQCLFGGATPNWGSCAAGINLWQENLGALSPANITDDLLLGGTSTASARFAFTNNIGSGTPTASISGASNNALSLNATGTIQTTNAQSLLLNPNGFGNVGVGTTTPTDTLTVNGDGRFYGAYTENTNNNGVYAGYMNGTPRIMLDTGNNTQSWEIDNNGGNFRFYNPNDTALTLNVTNKSLVLGNQFNSDYNTIQNYSNTVLQSYYNTANPTGTNTAFSFQTGSSPTTLLTLLNNGGAGFQTNLIGNSALVVNQPNSAGDIFAASQSGATKFQITNAGVINVVGGNATSDFDTLTNTTLKIGAGNATTLTLGRASNTINLPGYGGANNSVLFADNSGNGVLSKVLATSTANLCLLSGATTPSWGSCDLGTTSWVQSLGTIYPGNSTEDLLVGGTATSSAKFAFINVNSGTPTASISGSSNKALSLNATGTIQTTNAQSLLLNPNGLGNVGIGTANPASLLTVNGQIETMSSTAGIKLDARDNSGNFFTLYSATGDLTFYSNNGGIHGEMTPSGKLGLGLNNTSPLAQLDVRGDSGTIPVASISGNTSFAAAVIDQSGTGDIFTASKSGATKFVINNAGNVGIGISNPGINPFQVGTNLFNVDPFGNIANSGTITSSDTINARTFNAGDAALYANQSVAGATVPVAILQGGATPGAGADLLQLQNNNNIVLSKFNSNGQLTIQATGGTTPNASVSGATSFASLLVDNSGTGDIFTASKSGATKFVINNAGNIIAPNYAGTNAVLFANSGSGLFSNVTTGVAGQCLLSGVGTPTWGACDSGNTSWVQNLGTIYPGNSTEDLLVGGTATASADFAVTGMNTATPIASISAFTHSGNQNGLSLNASTSTIQSLNRNTLILGGSSTGNIAFQPGGVSSGSSLYLASSGNVGIGTATPNSALDINGNVDVDGSGNGFAVDDASTGTLYSAQFRYDSSLLGLSNIARIRLGGGTGMSGFGITNFDSSMLLYVQNNGNVGIGTTAPGAALDVRGQSGTTPVASISGASNFANLVVDQSGTGDLFTASKSGATKFVVTNSGRVNVAGGLTSDFDTLTNTTLGIGATSATTLTIGRSGQVIDLPGYGSANNSVLFADNTASGVLTKVLATSTANLCLLSGATSPSWGSCDLGTTSWVQNFGTIYPGNSTEDLLIGGTATASADFAVTGMNTATPIASISAFTHAGNKNGLSLNASASTIQSLNRNTLILGGSTTGDISFQPGGVSSGSSLYLASSGNVGIGTTTPNIGGYTGNVLTLAGANSPVIEFNRAISASATIIGTFRAGDTSGSALAGFNFSTGSTSTTGAIDFLTRNAVGLNTAMRIDENGNIGIGTTSPLATLDVRANPTNGGTTPVASFSGATTNASVIVDQSDSGDIFTASKSGATKFTIKNSGVVVIGNNTNGIIFDPTELSNPSGQIYFGTARPTKQITLTAEYPGAVIVASPSAGTNINGFMTASASMSATPTANNHETYYQWTSTQVGTLNQYTIALTLTLPKDWSAWPTSGNAMTIDYNTGLTTSADNALDVFMYQKGDTSGIPVYFSTNNKSSTAKNWTQVQITGAQFSGTKTWDSTNRQVTLYLTLKAMNTTANYVQVGDININYLSGF